jgi:hypothetical protein
MDGGLNSKAFMRLKLSLSLRQWSRDITNLKTKNLKEIKRISFLKFFFFEIFKKMSLLSQQPLVVC